MHIEKVLKLLRNTIQSSETMDHAVLCKLNRSQIQQLAKHEKIRANAKSDSIIAQLLTKYPGGVPKEFLASTPEEKRRSKRSTVKPVSVKVKKSSTSSLLDPVEESHRQSIASPRPARGLASGSLTTKVSPAHAPHSNTPASIIHPRPLLSRPSTPQRPPSPVQPTYHDTREILRTLTRLINATSLDSAHPTSIQYKINAIDKLLEDKVIPRLMKVDKDVKDLTWMRVSLENECVARFKEGGVLPEDYLKRQTAYRVPATAANGKRKRNTDEELDVSLQTEKRQKMIS